MAKKFADEKRARRALSTIVFVAVNDAGTRIFYQDGTMGYSNSENKLRSWKVQDGVVWKVQDGVVMHGNIGNTSPMQAWGIFPEHVQQAYKNYLAELILG